MATFDFTTHDTVPLLCRAWSDNVSSRRSIPKNWEEAMRHPSLRALSQRSTRRFASVASSVFSGTFRIQVNMSQEVCITPRCVCCLSAIHPPVRRKELVMSIFCTILVDLKHLELPRDHGKASRLAWRRGPAGPSTASSNFRT